MHSMPERSGSGKEYLFRVGTSLENFFLNHPSLPVVHLFLPDAQTLKISIVVPIKGLKFHEF
jgi:hypothetical protein